MNYTKENIKQVDVSGEVVTKPVEAKEFSAENSFEEENHPPIYDTQSLTKSRNFYIVGSLILVSVAALLVWLYFYRGQEGKAITAPRNVSFNENDNNNALTSAEQTLTLTSDQLKTAGLKIEKVGEGFSQESGTIASTGVVQANSYAETPVISLVGGVVRRLDSKLGQYVRRGQTVAIVSSDELANTASRYLSMLAEVDEAQKRYNRALKLTDIASESLNENDKVTTEIKTAEAEVAEYKSNFERTQKLVAIGAASRQELEQATTKLKTAQAQLVEANQRFERAKRLVNVNPVSRAELDQALRQMRSSEAEAGSIREKLQVLGLPPQAVERLKATRQISSELPIASPVSGTITARTANPGEIIAANKELLRVTDLSTVWVIGQVYEKDLAQLQTGSGVSITSDSYPGELFRGNISYIDPNLDQNTRTAQVRIELLNSDAKFRIGMYVNIAFATIGGSENTVPLISKEAVQSINNQQIVFVATDNPNAFILRPVKTGTESNGFYPVLGGLTVGENIVTEGSFLLRAEWQKSHPSGL